MANEEIQQHIEQNCRHEDGSHAMDEQAFYEGAKWMRDHVLRIHGGMCWVSVKDAMPTKDGQYCTYLQTSKYESIGFTQLLDGEFMSSFVTHWMEVVKPCQ